MKSSTNNNKTRYTVLPPLYLEDIGDKTANNNSNNDPQSPNLTCLPSELAIQCLTGYSSWGDLAKLATVASTFKNVVKDAANFGGDESKWELAQALLDGTHGLQCNPRLAITYLLELADNTDRDTRSPPYTPAMRKLSTCYLLGQGVEKDLHQGMKWLKEAARLGGIADPGDAAHEVALIYEYGEYGVNVDVVEAAAWFYQAAEQGHVEAMAEYAMCCELGCGVEQSDEEALEWYTRAASGGHVESNFSVGEAFEEAKGVPQSDEEACLWYYKAAVMGDEDSKKALKRLEDIARIVVPGWAAAVLRD